LRFAYPPNFFGQQNGTNLPCNMYLYHNKSQEQKTQLVRACLHWYVCTFAYRCCLYSFGSRSVVGIATTLRAGRNRVRIPVKATNFILCRHGQTGSGPIQPLAQHVLGLFLRCTYSSPLTTIQHRKWDYVELYLSSPSVPILHVRNSFIYILYDISNTTTAANITSLANRREDEKEEEDPKCSGKGKRKG
jgi:hypothetical protein